MSNDTTLQRDTLVSMKVVTRQTGLCDQSIRNLMAKGRFPLSIALTSRCVRWSQNEIDEWIARLKSER